MSVPNLTRYWVGCGLETEELTVDGVTVLLYPNSDQVSRLARLRAKGFAWETWLNPDWRLARARRNGELARLLESGLSEAAAMHAICGPIDDARTKLKPCRRGPAPAPLLGTDHEIECAREFIKQQRRLLARCEKARAAGGNPLKAKSWWAVEEAAEALIGRAWDVDPESAKRLVWLAVKRQQKALQISLI
jgi:hypothetical protein